MAIELMIDSVNGTWVCYVHCRCCFTLLTLMFVANSWFFHCSASSNSWWWLAISALYCTCTAVWLA